MRENELREWEKENARLKAKLEQAEKQAIEDQAAKDAALKSMEKKLKNMTDQIRDAEKRRELEQKNNLQWIKDLERRSQDLEFENEKHK